VSHRSRSVRHLGPILAVVVMAMSLLVGPGGQGATPVAASNASAARETASASVASAGTTAQAAECVTAMNLDHSMRNRAWRILIFVWARGSNNYLGLIVDQTSLRENPAGTWTRVENCDGGGPGPQPEVEGWPSVGRDMASTRAALNEDAITPANVTTLGRAWQDADALGVSGTPIVIGDTVYYGDWNNRVHARNATTGAETWVTDVGDRVPGAVAVDEQQVYAGTWDGRLVALNRQTGAKLWEKEVDTHEVAVVYGSPVVANGLVLVPVSSDEWWDGDAFTFRGSVVAYDAASGNERWRYWTSCGPENAGRNNCPAGAAEGAGVGTWSYPTIDTATNTVFFGTGNQYVAPASNRSDALIALDLTTGEQKWVRQFTEGDFWNLPGQTNPESGVGPDADAMVATLFRVGDVDAVGIGDKGGTYYAVNRETGAVIWERKLTEGSIQGGIMASAALVPAARAGRPNDVLYLTSNRAGTVADLVALDASNGEVINRVDVGGGVVSPVSWANGLVYVTDNTGRVSAHNASDLSRVWQWRTDAPAAGGIAVANDMVYAGYGWAVNGVSQRGGLIAFKLGGEPQDGGGGEEPDGAAIYAANCAACHGADGSGGAGPDLRGIGEAHTLDELIQVITDGRGDMPAWNDELSADEIRAVAQYVSEIPGDGHDHDHGGTTTTTAPGSTTTTAPPGTTTTTAPGTTTTTHGDHDH
jgi:polyvinyl alcohol dehydrogenase (cytochrome)